MAEQTGGFFERTQGKINPVAVEYFYGPRMAKSRESFPYLTKVMRAHVVMLAQCDIIPTEAAGKLAVALGRLQESSGQMALDPKLEDLYINMENILTDELGAEISGYLPVARSRNDVETAMWRIELREKLVVLANSLLLLIETCTREAKKHVDTIMPGYSYGQQAQPITLGYYWSGIVSSLLRDVQRIIDCIKRFNYCPLGAAALAGTGYPIDRNTTARLLGFDGVLEHSLDAVAGADYMLEACNIAAIALTTLSRLSEDVLRWCSNEVGFATLSEDLIDSSSIMPQKRNPVIVATVRAYSRLVTGQLSGIYAASSVGFEPSRDVTVAWDHVLECINTANGMCRITEAYVANLNYDKAAMEQSLKISLINATEIADTLVREGGMSFRIAHQIVGAAVADLLTRGEEMQGLDYDLLNNYSMGVTGKPLPVESPAVEQALSNRVGVDRRDSLGGTAPKEVRRMVTVFTNQANNIMNEIKGFTEQWERADKELQRESDQLMKK